MDKHERYDPWGVGEALAMAMKMYIHTKRATGRTTMLLDSLKEGDMVICATTREAQRIERLARGRGFEHVIAVGRDPTIGRSALSQIHQDMIQTKRRIVFDHTYFEALYWWVIHDTMSALTQLVNHHNERRAADAKDNPIYYKGEFPYAK